MDLIGMVLAAGRSRRAPSFKPLHPWNGEPLVRRAAHHLSSCCGTTYVVCGHRSEEVAAAVAGLTGIVAVKGADPDAPMRASIRTGLQAAPDDWPGLLLTPVDCLGTEPKVLRALIEAWTANPDRAAVPVHGGRRGHPVLLPSALRGPLLGEDDGQTLRDLMEQVGRIHVPVDDPDVLTDLDTDEDFWAPGGNGA